MLYVYQKQEGGVAMKIDLRIAARKIGFIFVTFGFFIIADTITKGASQKSNDVMVERHTTVPVVVQNNTVSIMPIANEELSQPIAGKLSLDQLYAISLEKKSKQIPTQLRSIATTDLFTQSQAHMSVPEVKKLIDATYDTKPYSKLIASILDREKEYAADYVFYHGTDNVWRLVQDVYTLLYAHFNNLPADLTKTFVFLRFEDVKAPISFQDFLITRLKENGLINDHTMGDFIIAANVALFGNVGTDPECSWQYFIKSRGHAIPNRATYEKIMDSFGLTHKYIDELMSLVKLYQTKEQTILQIFVPKDKVNSIGYLAWIRGIPAYQEMMHTVLKSVQDKKFAKTAPALDYYTSLFKGEQEKNPLFKGLMDRVKEGEFSLSYFLDFYRNQPDRIEDINNFQARLFITKDVLLNPTSGVKIFRCSMATDAQLKKYNEALDTVIQKILAEKK